MNLKKIFVQIKLRFGILSDAVKHIGIAWNYITAIGLMVAIIVLLTLNVFDVYSRGKENFDQLIYEKEKLDSLREESNELEAELQYRRSLQFVENYAHESLSLGRLGERLFKFDREADESYELEEINSDPIVLEDNEKWWQVLFF